VRHFFDIHEKDFLVFIPFDVQSPSLLPWVASFVWWGWQSRVVIATGWTTAAYGACRVYCFVARESARRVKLLVRGLRKFQVQIVTERAFGYKCSYTLINRLGPKGK
jgi:hypothetical protein